MGAHESKLDDKKHYKLESPSKSINIDTSSNAGHSKMTDHGAVLYDASLEKCFETIFTELDVEKPSQSLSDRLLKREHFEKHFGEALGSVIFSRWTVDIDRDQSGITVAQFKEHGRRILHSSNQTTLLINCFTDTSKLIEACCCASGVFLTDNNRKMSNSDKQTLRSLTEALTRNCTESSAVEWVATNCPRFADDLQKFTRSRLMNEHYQFPVSLAESNVLSALQQWYYERALPTLYLISAHSNRRRSSVMKMFKPETDNCENACWTILYDSAQHGLSSNRFEEHVLAYKAPTVTFLLLSDGSVFCLALDIPWRESNAAFGEASTCCIKLLPSYERIDYPTCTVRLQAHGRGVPGLLVTSRMHPNGFMRVPPDFGNVDAIEVWGCGPPSAVALQQQQKQWQSRQIERRQKLPLPGLWDDNPDKYLLEMAGVGSFGNREKLQQSDN